LTTTTVTTFGTAVTLPTNYVDCWLTFNGTAADMVNVLANGDTPTSITNTGGRVFYTNTLYKFPNTEMDNFKFILEGSASAAVMHFMFFRQHQQSAE